MSTTITRDAQFYKFSMYGFLKNLRFFDPFLILFFLEKGMSYSQIGVIYAIRHVAVQVLEIPSGIAADVFGRKKAMLTSFSAYIISFLVYFFSNSFVVLILATALFSIGEAFRSGTHKAMILDYLQLNGWEDQKTDYYGNTRSWSQIGSAISSVIAGLLVLWQGSYAPVFLFSLVPYVIELFLMMSYPKNLDGKNKDLSKVSFNEQTLKIFSDLKHTITQPRGLRTLGNLSLHTGIYKAFKDYLQPILKTMALAIPLAASLNEDQRTAVLSGIVYFVIYILTSLASRYSGRFTGVLKSETVTLNTTLILGTALAVVAGLAMVFELSPVATAMFILIMIMENLRKPNVVAYASDFGNDDSMASLLSTVSQMESLIAAVLGLALGISIDVFGLGTGLTVVAGATLLLSIPLLIPSPKKVY